MRRLVAMLALFILVGMLMPAEAQDVVPSVADVIGGVVDTTEGEEVSTSVRIVMILTALSMLPGITLLMTPFTRFVIVFALLRQALGLQQTPPNQVLVALSLILSMAVMQPTLEQVQADAVNPYLAGDIDTSVALDNSLGPMRQFMLDNVGGEELLVSLRLSRSPLLSEDGSIAPEDIPTPTLITGFVLGELQRAFIIAVQVYVPFLVVDIIVAAVLLGMGMMMLPPVVVSLPFKLLVFVLMDGWTLLVAGLVGSFT